MKQYGLGNPEVRRLTVRYILLGAGLLTFVVLVAFLSIFDWAGLPSRLLQALRDSIAS